MAGEEIEGRGRLFIKEKISAAEPWLACINNIIM
jgi:hypothetical protein